MSVNPSIQRQRPNFRMSFYLTKITYFVVTHMYFRKWGEKVRFLVIFFQNFDKSSPRVL